MRSVLLLTLLVNCVGCNDSWLKWQDSPNGSPSGGFGSPNAPQQVPAPTEDPTAAATSTNGPVWHDPSELTSDAKRVTGTKGADGYQGGEWVEAPAASTAAPQQDVQPNGLQAGRIPDDSIEIKEGNSLPAVVQPRRTYRVEKGDTLYAIYRKTKVHPHQLIEWNDLPKGNVIYVGQTIFLDPPRAGDADALAIKAGTATQLGYSRSVYQTEDDLPAGETINPETTMKQPTTDVVEPQPITPSDEASVSTAQETWIWPLGNPGDSHVTTPRLGHKGIMIDAQENETVRAVAKGEVVYVGSGQGALGQIIIIRHDNDVLTLYGNNTKALVKNKQIVKQGEPLATVAEYRAGKAGLYFEVRVDSVTVDPLSKLPK